MQDKEWQQLNLPETSTYIEFPIAFTGKTKSDKATVFAGLNFSCQFILAIIHTMNKAYGEPARLTYDYFLEEFGIYPNTLSAGLKWLKDCKIIEAVKQSRYKIKVSYNKRNCVKIDTYLLKQEFKLAGKKKRLTYSRLITLAFLKRSNENPQTGGVFISSQTRIAVALNMSRSTMGDCIRELTALDFTRAEKEDETDRRRRGCCIFTINPEILAVKHPIRQDKAAFEQERSAEILHNRLMLDTEFKELIEHIEVNDVELIKAIRQSRGNNTPELKRVERERDELRAGLEAYFKKKHIRRATFFPPGYFKCDEVSEN